MSKTLPENTAGARRSKGFMLFGVRVMEATAAATSSFRKSASMNNLAQFIDCEHQPVNDSNSTDIVAAGYASDDVVHPSARNRDRKRGVAWSEEEHRLFLLGLEKVGKGDWRGISRNFVKTRTPTQVASHAQKYFLRRNNQYNRRRRRSTLFDITTDTALGSAKFEDTQQQNQSTNNNINHLPVSAFPRTHKSAVLPVIGESSTENLSSVKMAGLSLNQTNIQELKLSTLALSSSPEQKSPAKRTSAAFHVPMDSTGTVIGMA